ncbi:hypothetical protein PLICRDRAFT_45202 [Plicaturopsis crispa FD-325 SS-3]|uniref:Unplaced genomic scaffold PLICRscaffold_15, whole genome shotgun sequence n=1 Tax=Plicaturopsis crispa FD-325 SS-3 TaxID=944288 RepID=A0A0C9SYI8_PLICR|nr:hypothetical protein PLICRDRAFT_45202 [Plicaturopsis crispa FD-325 SS-3]
MAEALPEYSAAPSGSSTGRPSISSAQRSEYVCALENSKTQKRWCTMYVKSRAPNEKVAPVFVEGDVVSGRVELDLESAEKVKGVTITVKGGTTSVGQEEEVFLEISEDLWTPSMGIPGETSSPSSSKLKGHFSWPFSLTLPRETTLVEKKGSPPVTFALPPTFSERASPAYIDYRIVATIKRPALKVNQTLAATFGYQPVSRAPPPSPLRQKAYKEGLSLFGPEGDPEGWNELPQIRITGTLFEKRTVEIECRVRALAIATPLKYALASPIPLTMTLSSTDDEALDLLSKSSSIRLYLVRSLAFGSDASTETTVRRSNNFFKESMGRAAFWPASEGMAEAGKRTLQGEIDVPRTLKPSFVFPRFAVRYTVDLLAFDAPGFAPSTPTTAELSSTPMTLVTAPAAGITARSYAPPGYVHPQGGDYNKAMGLLENGNQRFYHHTGAGAGPGL